MAYQRPKNDGRGRMGGRQKGTPNKIPSIVRSSIARLCAKYYDETSGELRASDEDEIYICLENDIKQMGPRERALVMEKYVGYVTPKLQTTTLEMAVESKKTIEDILSDLSGTDGGK